MSIEITVRHVDVLQEDREYAQDLGEQIAAAFPRVEHIHIILDGQKYLKLAEIVVQAKNHIRVEAKEESEAMRASLDLCFAKVETQLRRLRDKIQSRKVRTSAAEFEQAQASEPVE
ncbi:MAG: HPF/RaiA family ribosome-associated protein [Verrucomicrobia bacterium]|nr:HPF/RaiA family ribosome-associated protein [Verrucomicrobiota bacterium]MDA1087597.1 HPF/RaiA family ribosome-associated protein [Verrucomicrobiota bacterium]